MFGVLPTVGEHISWDGHLWSAVAGGLIAWRMARDSKSQAKLTKA
jgi:membrane associated rhomboid family serine protease